MTDTTSLGSSQKKKSYNKTERVSKAEDNSFK